MFCALIVDDEERIRKSFVSIGKWADYEIDKVYEAEDGIQAYALICRLQPEIIILDMDMPLLDGEELLKRLQYENIKSKVVVISGYEDFKYTHQALLYGAVDYLLKPVNRERFNDVLRQVAENLKKEAPVNQKLPSIGLSADPPLAGDIPISNLNIDSRSSMCIAALIAKKQEGVAIFNDFNTIHNFDGINISYIGGNNPQYYILYANQPLEIFNEKTVVCLESLLKKYGSQHNRFGIYLGKSFTLWDETKLHIMNLRGSLDYVDISDFPDCVVQIDKERLNEIEYPSTDEEFNVIKGKEILEPLKNLREAIDCRHFNKIFQIRKAFFDYITALKVWCEQYKFSANFLYNIIREFEIALSQYELEKVLGQLDLSISLIYEELYKKEFSDKDIFDTIRLFIETNYYKKITLDTLCQKFYFSKEYLSREFKKRNGVNLIHYLNEIRLEKAKELLGQGINVSTACERVGFNDTNYFCKLFKKKYKISPGSLKKEINKKIQ